MVCVRWVDEDFISHEDFIGLHEMEKTDATSTVVVLKDIILRLGLVEKNYKVSVTVAAVP